VLACVLITLLTGANRPTAPAPLLAAGLLGNGDTLTAVAPADAAGATWLGDSLVLRLPDGRLRYLPPGAREPVTVPATDAGAHAAAAADRAWLRAGDIPGADARRRDAAARSLLFLRGLIRPGGGVVAAPQPRWAYVWPRDASFAAAAFAATGHRDEAAGVLAFLAREQRPDGTWPARSQPGGGEVGDGRPAQLDATGWVPWAAWVASRGGADRTLAATTWPMVARAAHAAARSLRSDGLPPAGPDYWERRERQPTLGTAAPLRAGLRAAARLADRLGHAPDAAAFRAAAARVDRAIRQRLHGPGAAGYERTPAGGGPDAAVAWLAPPFAPPERAVTASVWAAWARLASAGGAVPGSAWAGEDPWTPATAGFALAAAAGGDQPRLAGLLGWLLEHRTVLGAFPERVRRHDRAPRSAAPLAWTHALVVLALAAAERPLPVP
jgi:glucoamylase